MKNILKIIMLLTMSMVLILSGNFVISVVAEPRESQDNFAVVVKENGLSVISLSKIGNEAILDEGGTFKNLNISPDGKNVAYTKDETLYITAINHGKGDKKVLEVSKKPVSYAWCSSNNLSYSTEMGGLYGFNLESGKSSVYIKSENHYEGIQSDGHRKIYGQLLRYYTKNEEQYIEDIGVICFDTISKKEKVIIPSIPSSESDLGFMPQVVEISKDGAYVYIWCKVHSASTNTDGVQFGVYDVKNNKLIKYSTDKIFMLAYSDNLAINPIDGRLPVLNNGEAREMNVNKTLGILDISSGAFTNILPDYMISTGEHYGIPAKGMVTMTPAFSKDAKKVIFAASKANEDMQQWHKEPHNIYTVDIKSKKVEKITKGKTFDFAPMYLSDMDEIIFVRRDDENNISLWKIKGNKEERITSNIKLDEYSWFYGHYNLDNSLAVYVHYNQD